MHPFALALSLIAALSLPATTGFEITSNKPFVPVTVDGSAPLWFVLDTGARGQSIVALESADRLGIGRKGGEKADIGAGSGAAVVVDQAVRPLRLGALGDTLTLGEPLLVTLGHVARVEGRRVDGLLGGDFFARRVVEIDYANQRVSVRDPQEYAPPKDAIVVPIELDTGWPVVVGTITPPGGKPLPCRLLIDTGVRNTVTMFRPFSVRHGLHDVKGSLRNRVTGFGVGGPSRGDVSRVESLTLGSLTVERPVATFSRDTSGVLASDGPDGIVGGELLRRHKVTFDYPHGRMILEPYPGRVEAFEYDMSGLFLAADPPDFRTVRILDVQAGSPAAEAKLETGDEIVSIDGKAVTRLTLDEARDLLRVPGTRRLEVRRQGAVRTVRLEARRLT